MALRSAGPNETLLVQDTFTGSAGTNLHSHFTDDGNGFEWDRGRWVDSGFLGDIELTGSNIAETVQKAEPNYYWIVEIPSGSLSPNNYIVEADVRATDLPVNNLERIRMGVTARGDTQNNPDVYVAAIHFFDDPGVSELAIYRYNTGGGNTPTQTELVTTPITRDTNTHRITLQVEPSGSDVKLTATFDGSTSITFTDTSVDKITQIGKAGLFQEVDQNFTTFEVRHSNYQVFSVSPPSTPPVPIEFGTLTSGCVTGDFFDEFNDTLGVNIEDHIPDQGAGWVQTEVELSDLPVTIHDDGYATNVNAGTGLVQPQFVLPAGKQISSIIIRMKLNLRTITSSSSKGFFIRLWNSIQAEYVDPNDPTPEPLNHIDVGASKDDSGGFHLGIQYYQDGVAMEERVAALPTQTATEVALEFNLTPIGAFVNISEVFFDDSTSATFDSTVITGNPPQYFNYSRNIYGNTFSSTIPPGDLAKNIREIATIENRNEGVLGDRLGTNSLTYSEDFQWLLYSISYGDGTTVTDLLQGTPQSSPGAIVATPVITINGIPNAPQPAPTVSGSSGPSAVVGSGGSGPGTGSGGPASVTGEPPQGPGSPETSLEIQGPTNEYRGDIVVFG